MMNQDIAEALLNEEEFEGEEDYLLVAGREFNFTSRWYIYWFSVYKHKPTDTFWRVNWCRGLTEQQDNGIEDVVFDQVKPVTHTIVVYE